MFFLITTLCIILTYVTYKYFTINYDYWKKKKIPFDNPKLFFGSIKDAVFLKRPIPQLIEDLYRKYPDSPFIGFYKMRTPCLLLTKPEHIEQAFVQDSDFFWKNELIIEPSLDPVLAGSLFSKIGQKWKKTRELFTPILTTAKIKHIFPFLIQPTKKLIDYIDKNKTCEARDLLMRYVADANALAAFGIEGESFEKDDAFFRKLGQEFMEPGFSGLKLLIIILLPNLAKILHLKCISSSAVKYMKEVISTTLKHRKGDKINNEYILDSILKLKSETFTDLNVLSFAFSFFLDPTTANQGSYILYALASNPDVQQKLKDEIDEVLNKHENITFDAIQEMNYLDCVILETMRLYPSLQANMKQCTGYYEFKLEEGQNEVVSLEPGMSIVASVIGMHHDERYFENPMKFIPERFSEGNKGKIKKCTYMPFGLGGRICAGMKFAMILMKISTVVIIKEFEVSVNEKTGDPFDLNAASIMAIPKTGIWINFKSRV